jgi:hypothetical protein
VKKTEWMIVAALLLAASVARAQGSDELAALQKQLNELSAKIAQLEASNTERISKLESDNATKIAKLEADAAKNKIPAWVNDTKFKGDFRYRYENVQKDTDTNQDRQRIRLRVGAYGTVNDFVDYGIRMATGGSATSANQTLGDDNKSFSFMLDQVYVDLHPEMLHGAHLFMGKMPQPWLERTGLIWDGDLNPEGVALTYKTAWTNGFNLLANAGSFAVHSDSLEKESGSDLQLWAAQLAAEQKVGDAKVTLGVSDFYYSNVDAASATALAKGNTAGTEFHLIEGFGKVDTKIAGLPVSFNGQYVVNTEAITSEDTAYLFGVSAGKAKNKGDWEVGYNYRDTQKDAVPDGFNDSDFANGGTDAKGHSFWAKYQIAKNLQGGLTYLMAVNGSGEDIDTFQADLNFKF